MNTENPLISIIIPIYNSEKYLKKGLDSCIEQTYDNIEIICVDDASTDGSREFVENYVKKYPEKVVQICLKKNVGQGGARNAGIEAAKGKYICFLDSDDYLDTNLCKDVFEAVKDTNVDLVYFDFYKVNANEIYPVELISQEDIPYWHHNTGCAVWLQMIKKEILIHNQLLSPEKMRAADDAITPLWKFYASKKIKLQKSYYYYVNRDDSLVNSTTVDKVITPIEQVIPYRNQKFYERNLEILCKKEIDILMAKDIVNTLKRMLQLEIFLSKQQMVQLREKTKLPNDYRMDEYYFIFDFNQAELRMLDCFLYAPEQFFSHYQSYQTYLQEAADWGYCHEIEEKLIKALQKKNLEKGKKVAVWGLNDRALALYTTFKRIGYQVCLFDDIRKQTDVGGDKVEVYSDDDLKKLGVDVVFTSTYFLFKKTQTHVRKVNEKVKVLNGLEFISHLVWK